MLNIYKNAGLAYPTRTKSYEKNMWLPAMCLAYAISLVHDKNRAREASIQNQQLSEGKHSMRAMKGQRRTKEHVVCPSINSGLFFLGICYFKASPTRLRMDKIVHWFLYPILKWIRVKHLLMYVCMHVYDIDLDILII